MTKSIFQPESKTTERLKDTELINILINKNKGMHYNLKQNPDDSFLTTLLWSTLNDSSSKQKIDQCIQASDIGDTISMQFSQIEADWSQREQQRLEEERNRVKVRLERERHKDKERIDKCVEEQLREKID